MVQDPNNNQDQAFGFSNDANAPRDEKYDTRYIVESMKRDERRPQIIMIGVVVLMIAGLVYFLSRPTPPKHGSAEGANAVQVELKSASKAEAPKTKAEPAPAASPAPASPATPSPESPAPKK